MPRKKPQIENDLAAAHALDRTLALATPEYRENRKRIGVLVRELLLHMPLTPVRFTHADYDRWPDSFEQMGINARQAAREAEALAVRLDLELFNFGKKVA